jgi:long-chain acyl-CoA synthetase
VPGTEKEGRTPIYRHWQLRDAPLIETFDPAIQTTHDLFEESVRKHGPRKCLGTRPWNPTTKAWENTYVWESYNEVAVRRKNLGAGLVEIHERIGCTDDKYAVGLWSQNRADWQIAGTTQIPCRGLCWRR